MPLKPCLKSAKATSSCFPANNRPPIPLEQNPIASLPYTASNVDYSALPYAQPFVHFPPSPTLTSTYVVDPPRLYDRTPIVVSENACALPQRGCPGRTYTTNNGDLPHPSHIRHGGSNARRMSPADATGFVPGLVSDEGSSEDSDGLSQEHIVPRAVIGVSPFCTSQCTLEYHAPQCPTSLNSSRHGRDSNPSTFLPHPPSPRTSRNSLSTPTHSSYSSRKGARTTRPGPTFSSTWDSSSCLGGF